MTEDRSREELELLAYADGLLDEDPCRKAQVEARLQVSPATALRVEAYREQNAALRARYGDRVAEEVPHRLYAALDGMDRGTGAGLLQLAAAVLVAFAAGSLGWWIGHQDREVAWSASEFLQQSFRSYADNTPSRMAASGGAPDTREPMTWLSGRISPSLHVPDLSALGFTLAEQTTVSVSGDQMVRLNYVAPDGGGFSLFIRPRWEDTGPNVRLVREDDVSLAYWQDGPLASAIVSRLPQEQVLELADAVRAAIHDRRLLPPKVRTAPLAPSLRGDAPSGEAAAAQPSPSQFVPSPLPSEHAVDSPSGHIKGNRSNSSGL